MIDARAAGQPGAAALVLAVGTAATLRAVIGGAAPAASVPAAAVFGAMLSAAVLWGGATVTRVSWRGVTLGVGGGVALVGVSLSGLPVLVIGPRTASSGLLWWVPLVTGIAALEELVLRGVLFDAVRSLSGDGVAVLVTALLFAVIHVPLYGIQALPIDLCVGVFLGCLRVATGGVTAPLVAHVLADVATGWVG